MKIKGSKWWKFDFHVHTPASVDYGKDEVELKKIRPREWLLNVMDKGIDCIAITDHNTGAWIDILKNELANMKEEECEGYRDLYLFPGIEITVNGGIHLLAIFDLNKGSEDIAELIGSIEYSGTKGDSDGCTRKSFEHVIQDIINKGGIPIPAHVDIESGIFKEESGVSLRDSIKSEGILALEVHDPEFNKPQVYKELMLNHSEVIGSDSHKPKDIGRFFTWVKMEEPSLDALWLALHDGKDGVLRYDDNSIRYNPNDITSRFFIKKLTIENGAKIGLGPNKFEIEFSPWMSTIIGGRGSGKSSILNYIRLAINGKEELTESLKSEFEEFAKVSEGRNKIGMLRDDTKIRIEMLKDNREIALIWDKYDIYEEHYDQINDQWIEKGKAMDINKRFPIRIFNQKELYEITKDPKVILNIIDGLTMKEDIDIILENLKDQWKESKRIEYKLKKDIVNKDIIKINLSDIEAKMKVFEESDYASIIEEYKNTKSLEYSINGLFKEHIENIKKIEDMSKLINLLSMPEDINEKLDDKSKEIIKSKIDNINNKLRNIVQEVDSLLLDKEKTKNIIENLPWNDTRKSIELKYQELVDRIGSDTPVDINVYTKLVEDKKRLEIYLKNIESIEESYSNQVNKSDNLLAEINKLNIELRKKRVELIEEWNNKNLGIKIKLNLMGDIINAEQEFRKIIRKTDTTFKKDICEIDDDGVIKSGIIYDICNIHKSEDSVEKIFESLTNKMKNLCDIDNDIYENYSKNFNKHMRRIYETNREDINELMLWVPEDKVKLSIVDNKREIDVDQGSAGQRTAAILALILSLDDRPLIIDQPEDDLDTKRISDLVVTGIRNLKLKQQVIVVTHNPNIPVNGASEQVIQLGFINGQINKRTYGALQKKDVREAICDVMEGGKVALNNRYHRISKALE